MYHYVDDRAVSRQGLVHGVVHDLVHEVVQPFGPGRADIHSWPLTNRFETFKNLDIFA
jgi:hypothetical protein